MMWPQVVLTVYLCWLLIVNLVKTGIEAAEENASVSELGGAVVGVTAKYGTMFACLYYGGFYS